MGLPRLACLLVAALALLPASLPAATDNEVRMRPVSPAAAEALRRYRDRLQSSARYDPSDQLPELPYGPAPKERSALGPKKDAHAGVPGANARSCGSCHRDSAANTHTVQGNITCRQCHSGNPIASTDHYFSPMNPIRRHAYVCAKCHEGASASFATYVVHISAEADGRALRKTFPALYWADVLMFSLIIGVFFIFLPHGIAWWVREWFVKRNKEG